MTVTDLTVVRARHRVRLESTATPESQDAANLQAMLDDPDLAGYHDDIRAALTKLTATSALAA